MKKYIVCLLLMITLPCLAPLRAAAVVEGVLTVGLRWGDTALPSANLENAVGSGYAFGYYDGARRFVPLDQTDCTAITMTGQGEGVTVTETKSGQVLYTFDTPGQYLGVQPLGDGTLTWFKGNRYPGGFEYRPGSGGLTVINVVGLEDYVRGVVPYEMDKSWPLAALEAQAVCARTYAAVRRHPSLGFDVCSGTDCQVYYGHSRLSERTDSAVANTAGQVICYGGSPIRTAVYCASNGGASEDAVNVWGSEIPYLTGKQDPYEGQITIPNYNWSVTYTPQELTWILEQKGYDIGTVEDVYVSAYTPQGNVKEVRFEGSRGGVTVKGETCRTVFYSSTYGKSARSQRFTVTGGSGGKETFAVAGGGVLTGLPGLRVIAGGGIVGTLGAALAVCTADGVRAIAAQETAAAEGFTLTGSGTGHNLGMSQYGARAMALAGYGYRDILQFYYTGVTIEQEAS